jgi:hypothetical protein
VLKSSFRVNSTDMPSSIPDAGSTNHDSIPTPSQQRLLWHWGNPSSDGRLISQRHAIKKRLRSSTHLIIVRAQKPQPLLCSDNCFIWPVLRHRMGPRGNIVAYSALADRSDDYGVSTSSASSNPLPRRKPNIHQLLLYSLSCSFDMEWSQWHSLASPLCLGLNANVRVDRARSSKQKKTQPVSSGVDCRKASSWVLHNEILILPEHIIKCSH